METYSSWQDEVVILDDEEEEAVTLPGFRFHPTDEELVAFYLRRKVEKKPMKTDIIKQVDIYKYEPWDLPRVSNAGDKEWYFFCPRGRKYRNSVRPNRVTGSGFWKATGIDRPVYVAGGKHECVGLKKSLVYYRGSAGKGVKTDWMMHEFRLPTSDDTVNNSCTGMQENPGETWTICRIFKRTTVSHRRQARAESWTSSAEPYARQAPSSTVISSKTCSAGDSNNSSNSDYWRGQQVLNPANEHSNFRLNCDNSSVVTGNDDKPQIYAIPQGNYSWDSPPQTQAQSPDVSYNTSLDPVVSNNILNDILLKDQGNINMSWEEIGWIVELSADPLPIYV